MTETKHTPTPWECAESHAGYLCIYPKDDSNKAVARIEGCIQANAEFIVRACNAHDDLVAALDRAEIRLESIIDFIERHCSGENATAKRNIAISIQKECKVALAKVRGEA